MVVDGIILSVVIGIFRKGNFSFLTKPIFKWGWIFPFLLFIQVLTFTFQNRIQGIGELSNYIFLFVYITGLFFLWINRQHIGLKIVFVGVFLNFVVMALNSGRMPVSEEASLILDPMYIDSIKDGLYGKHALLTESTRLAFLSDIIPITSPYPRDQVISIGDVIMNIGIFYFIQHQMLKGISQTNESFKFKEEGGKAV